MPNEPNEQVSDSGYDWASVGEPPVGKTAKPDNHVRASRVRKPLTIGTQTQTLGKWIALARHNKETVLARIARGHLEVEALAMRSLHGEHLQVEIPNFPWYDKHIDRHG